MIFGGSCTELVWLGLGLRKGVERGTVKSANVPRPSILLVDIEVAVQALSGRIGDIKYLEDFESYTDLERLRCAARGKGMKGVLWQQCYRLPN